MTTESLPYDVAGRLCQIPAAAAGTASFLYDGDELAAEYGSSGMLRRYVHGASDDDPIIWYEGSSVSAASRRYLLANWQGSVVSVQDNVGSVLALNLYDEYGIPASTNQGRFQYTGQT